MARIGATFKHGAIRERNGTVACAGYLVADTKVYFELSSQTTGERERLDNGTGAAVYALEVAAADDERVDVLILDDGTYTVSLTASGVFTLYHGDLKNGFSVVT
jgi:hypothetical protein